jgi:hypothetical protein
VKVTDERGRVSYQILDERGVIIYVHLSDQLTILADGRRDEGPYRLSTLLRTSDKIDAAHRAPWAQFVRGKLDQCRTLIPSETNEDRLKLRLLFDQKGGLSVVSFPHDLRWIQHMRCLVEHLDQAPRNFMRSTQSGRNATFSIELLLQSHKTP